jgi:hypothetical protein
LGNVLCELEQHQGAQSLWCPNVGPQLEAFFSPADELFFGGSAGSSKTDLGLGLALTQHKRSLILRRYNKDAVKLADRMSDILGSRDGYNGQQQRWRRGEQLIEFWGVEYEDDVQRFKGNPSDVIIFDEGADFSAKMYRFITAWNRSTDPNQRCRVVIGSNPPTSPEGLWLIQYFSPWLDPLHPNPAAPGELRWFTAGEDGADVEVEGRGPHIINGEKVWARSRTFIPGKLCDNPDLSGTGYASVLAGQPPELA